MNCNSCDFETSNKNDFRRHIESQTHGTNCFNKLVCKKCLRQFKKKCGLIKHSKTCKVELAPVQRNKSNAITIAEKPAESNTINNTQVNNIQFNHCSFAMSINDLIGDPFTTSNHRLTLEQMKRETSDIYDYLIDIDNDIQRSMDEFNIQQVMDLKDGYIREIKPFKLRIITFFSHVIVRLCQSTQKLVITHRDLTLNGSDRELLFKHGDELHSDIIIKALAKQSRHSEIIEDDDSPLPKFPSEYNELLIILYQQAMHRKNEHNRNIVIANARRD